MPRPAVLRVCASCEFIYKNISKSATYPEECPVCGFASYGAFSVYGNQAYRFAKTQKPYIDRKVRKYRWKIVGEVYELMNKGE